MGVQGSPALQMVLAMDEKWPMPLDIWKKIATDGNFTFELTVYTKKYVTDNPRMFKLIQEQKKKDRERREAEKQKKNPSSESSANSGMLFY